MSPIVSLRPCLDDIDPDQLSAIFHNLLLLNDEEREREREEREREREREGEGEGEGEREREREGNIPLSRKAAVSINEDDFSIRTTS